MTLHASVNESLLSWKETKTKRKVVSRNLITERSKEITKVM